MKMINCKDMTISQMCRDAHENAQNKGFFEGCDLTNPDVVNGKLMLIVSELGEACEAVRKGNPKCNKPGLEFMGNFEEEMADVVIRVGDLMQAMGYNLEDAIEAKMKYNLSRPYKHNKLT